MSKAIEIARRNARAPFGAVLVRDGEIVAEGFNRTHENPILHGEINVINNYALTGLTEWGDLCLYTTAEPCAMCQSAILWAGIPQVVYGTSIERLVKLGWNQFKMRAKEVVSIAPFASCSVLGGVMEEQCDQLFLDATHKHRKPGEE
jgi:tRNA(Arg) A34 adenosine deaminase TadA